LSISDRSDAFADANGLSCPIGQRHERIANRFHKRIPGDQDIPVVERRCTNPDKNLARPRDRDIPLDDPQGTEALFKLFEYLHSCGSFKKLHRFNEPLF
jgi:hypothetical protein